MWTDVIEAKDLGLPPGVWPLRLVVTVRDGEKEFLKKREVYDEATLRFVEYRSADGAWKLEIVP